MKSAEQKQEQKNRIEFLQHLLLTVEAEIKQENKQQSK